jgi:LCP family protein required for cell wall assembly
VIFGVLLVLVSGGLIAASKVLANRYDKAVNKGTLLDQGARRDTITTGRHLNITGPLNYLLLGSDARDDSPDAGQRSDTIIIVHIPSTLDRAYLISIPRDLRVEIPADRSLDFAGSTEKINGAFEYGRSTEAGARLVSATLNKLTGISFDGAAIINFDGFTKAVNLLGGVDMCVDEHTESQHIGYDKDGNFLAPWTGPDGEVRVPASTPKTYEVGCRHFLPWEALDYVRQRKSLPDGDYGRQRHQQQFLRALLQAAVDKNYAEKPLQLDQLIRAVGSSLTVDTNGVPLTELAYGLHSVRPSSLVGIKLPSEAQYLDNISYVLPIEEPAGELYQALRTDRLDEWIAGHPAWVNTL